MTSLAYGVSAALCALSVLHLVWAMRVWWPIGDEPALARAVAGFAGISSMPSAGSCLLVAIGLAGMAVVALELGGLRILGLDRGIAAAGFAATAVFLIRGGVGYTRFWSRLTPEHPFRSLDPWIYSPLCIGLGLGFAVLLWSFLSR